MTSVSHTVVLAAGDFPKRGGYAWQILEAAKRVVACDAAASSYRRHFHRWPTVTVGDIDSLKGPCPASLVRVAEQETNDLEKALSYCAQHGWRSPVIVGATGKREDHALGNLFRGLEHGLEIVTDHGRFLPVFGRRVLRVEAGIALSIFAPDPTTRMTSRGLEWPLDEVRFTNLYCATLNRATTRVVRLTSTRPVYAYVAFGTSRR